MILTDSISASELAQLRLVAFDFDGVFTDNTVYVFQDGQEAVRCWRSDGLGLARLKQLGLGLVILSTETNPVVTERSRKLGIECKQGLDDKRAALEELMRTRGLERREVAFVGNDVNDTGCLEYAGMPIVVQDAHPAVLAHARYRTSARGGFGAVREVCDLIAEAMAQGMARTDDK